MMCKQARAGGRAYLARAGDGILSFGARALNFRARKKSIGFFQLLSLIERLLVIYCRLVTDYVVRPYRQGDEEEIVRLLEMVFEGWPKFDLSCASIDHWRWKYQDNPFKQFIIAVTEINNEIVGVAHSFILFVKVGNEVHFCTFGGDTGVHPNFRRKGIHKMTSELEYNKRMEAGSQYHYLITSNPIVIKSFLKPSSRRKLFPYKMSTRVRIQDLETHLNMNPVENTWLIRLGFNAVKLFNDISNIFEHIKSTRKKIIISEISLFDDRITEFWRQISEHYHFIVEKNPDYLNWRYCDLRGGEYIIKIAEEDNRILGYSVLRINRYRKDYPVGYIVDFLSIPERFDVANALMADAVNYFDSHHVNIVRSLVVKNHPLERIHQIHGFLDSRRSPHIFYLAYGTEDILSSLKTHKPNKGAHFVFGDTDAI